MGLGSGSVLSWNFKLVDAALLPDVLLHHHLGAYLCLVGSCCVSPLTLSTLLPQTWSKLGTSLAIHCPCILGIASSFYGSLRCSCSCAECWMFYSWRWKEWWTDDDAWSVLSLARGGPGFGGGVGDGLRVWRLHRIELVKRYLVSREVGGLRERFFVTLRT